MTIQNIHDNLQIIKKIENSTQKWGDFVIKKIKPEKVYTQVVNYQKRRKFRI